MAKGETQSEAVHLLVVFACVLGVYLVTMPRTVTLEDSGLFILSSYFAGLSHPPGYPLHALLGKLFTWLPVGSVALRVHLLSAVCGAGACSVLWWVARKLGLSPSSAYAAALGYGYSKVFWSQSIIAEVYSLNSLLFFLQMAACLHYRERPRPRVLQAIALAYGLGLSNHWPMIVLETPCLLLLLAPRWREVLAGLPRAAPCLAVGLLPYAYMVVRSQTAPEISFYGPIDSFSDFKYWVGREGYPALGIRGAWREKWRFLVYGFAETGRQLTWLGAALAAIGVAWSFRRCGVGPGAGLVLGFLANSMLLFLVHDAMMWKYNYFNRSIVGIYPHLAYGILALWMGMGLEWLTGRLRARPSLPARLGKIVPAAVLPLVVLVSHWSGNFRRDDVWARRFAEAVLSNLEPDAILFTRSDFETGALAYLNRVEHFRPDVELYHRDGLVFRNRLFDGFESSDREITRALSSFVEGTERPIYSFSELPHRYGVIDHGFYQQVDRTQPEGASVRRPAEGLRGYMEWVASREGLVDPWTIVHRQNLLVQAARVLTPVVHEGKDEVAKAYWSHTLESVASTYPGKLASIALLVDSEDPDRLLAELEDAESEMDETWSPARRASLHLVRALLMRRRGERSGFIENLERAVEVHPRPGENPAVWMLLRHHAEEGDPKEYERWRTRFARRRILAEELEKLDRIVQERPASSATP